MQGVIKAYDPATGDGLVMSDTDLGDYELAADALAGLMSPKPEATLPLLREFLDHAGHDNFDLEAANIALSLWERVPANVRPAADHEALIERIALRFCTSKAVGELWISLKSPRGCCWSSSASFWCSTSKRVFRAGAARGLWTRRPRVRTAQGSSDSRSFRAQPNG